MQMDNYGLNPELKKTIGTTPVFNTNELVCCITHIPYVCTNQFHNHIHIRINQ